MSGEGLCIHYHRDFDGMCAAAILAHALKQTRNEDTLVRSVNYDQRRDWENFSAGERFAIVDFHFHPRADYWFDHHPTTFLSPELRAQYAPSERWCWDETSPSCPPIILRHAHEHWGYEVPERFEVMARWSDIVDAARYESVDQALFGDDPALRISRSLAVAPHQEWIDELVCALVDDDLETVARRRDLDKAWQRAARNRDKALEQFPPTVRSLDAGVLLYDASSNRIRRERFAPFFHHPEMCYAVGVIPTRAGFHVTAGVNPWKLPDDGIHIGEIMEEYGGGGHRSVGGANPNGLDDARRVAEEIAVRIRTTVLSRASESGAGAS